jgi:hypothetical protein
MEHSPYWSVQAGDEACFVKDRRNEVVPRDINRPQQNAEDDFFIFGGCYESR